MVLVGVVSSFFFFFWLSWGLDGGRDSSTRISSFVFEMWICRGVQQVV